MAIKLNAHSKDIKINTIDVWNDEGTGKIGLKADKIDDCHIEDIEKKIGYRVEINSSRGDKFRPGQTNTILSARVYQGQIEITDMLQSTQFRWTRTSDDTNADNTWNQNHFTAGKSIAITGEDVKGRATFNCEVIEL